MSRSPELAKCYRTRLGLGGFGFWSISHNGKNFLAIAIGVRSHFRADTQVRPYGLASFHLFERNLRPLRKVPLPVILRERSDRRISQVPRDARSFAALRMKNSLFAEVLLQVPPSEWRQQG